MTGEFCPFFAAEDRRGTYAVTDGFYNQIDNIPTLTAAETIAGAMNRAWERGHASAQKLGLRE
jgi:hypothetical protein